MPVLALAPLPCPLAAAASCSIWAGVMTNSTQYSLIRVVAPSSTATAPGTAAALGDPGSTTASEGTVSVIAGTWTVGMNFAATLARVISSWTAVSRRFQTSSPHGSLFRPIMWGYASCVIMGPLLVASELGRVGSAWSHGSESQIARHVKLLVATRRLHAIRRKGVTAPR